MVWLVASSPKNIRNGGPFCGSTSGASTTRDLAHQWKFGGKIECGDAHVRISQRNFAVLSGPCKFCFWRHFAKSTRKLAARRLVSTLTFPKRYNLKNGYCSTKPAAGKRGPGKCGAYVGSFKFNLTGSQIVGGAFQAACAIPFSIPDLPCDKPCEQSNVTFYTIGLLVVSRLELRTEEDEPEIGVAVLWIYFGPFIATALGYHLMNATTIATPTLIEGSMVRCKIFDTEAYWLLLFKV